MSDIASAFLNTPVPPESTSIPTTRVRTRREYIVATQQATVWTMGLTSKVPTTSIIHTTLTWLTTTTMQPMCLPQRRHHCDGLRG
eukprot:1999085-Amphidinium_carterae.1